MNILAQGTKNINDIIGEPIKPPGPNNLYSGPVTSNIALLFAFSVKLIFVVAGLICLIYLLWGSLDIITAGGDKDNMSKARGKINNALIGVIVIIAVFVIWVFLTNIFGLTQSSNGQLQFKIPGFGK